MNPPSHDSSGPKRKRQAAASDSADAANMAQSHLSVPQNLSREISRIGLGISTRLDYDSDAAQIQHPNKRMRMTDGSDSIRTGSSPTHVGSIDNHPNNGDTTSNEAEKLAGSRYATGPDNTWVLNRQMSTKETEHFRQTITESFSTRILYKHNELRLIDQEIAKCQVALEQLRRCSEIPYPSLTGLTSDMMNIGAGSGSALIPPQQSHPPTSPAPWGVADGPYTRHYAQWLLHDPIFDGGVNVASLTSAQTTGDITSRVRGAPGLDSVLTSNRSRTARGSSHTILQSLPSGYAQPKPERSAQVIKRHSDGMFVKLVCPGDGCGEERFNSVQGFINHCRIKHQIHFATHEDAAQRAGTIEGVDQRLGLMAGGVPEPSQVTAQERRPSVVSRSTDVPVDAPATQVSPNIVAQTTAISTRRSSSDLNRPSSPAASRHQAQAMANNLTTEQKSVFSSAFTHSYNKPGLDTVREWPDKRERPTPPTSPRTAAHDRQRRQSNMGPPISPAFVASTELPYLSERFAHSGKAGNLQAMVEEARDRFELDSVIEPEDNTDNELTPTNSPRSRRPKAHETVGRLGAPPMDRRPGSKKGLDSRQPERTTAREGSTERDEMPFLSNTRSRRQRRKPEPLSPTQSRTMRPGDPSNQLHTDAMALDAPVTADLHDSYDHPRSTASESPVELSPGAQNATDTNQAPSLVSDDGQSVSEYEEEDDMEEDGQDTPKTHTDRAHISFDGNDEVMTDGVGPSSLGVDAKMGGWHGASRDPRRQSAA